MHSYNKKTGKVWKRADPIQKSKKFSDILEALGGDEKAKPHSTKKGRVSSGIRKLVRTAKTSKKN